MLFVVREIVRSDSCGIAVQQKASIHQVTTMLADSKLTKNVLFLDHNHQLTTGTDDPSFLLSPSLVLGCTIKVSCYQYQWLAGGYDLEIGHF